MGRRNQKEAIKLFVVEGEKWFEASDSVAVRTCNNSSGTGSNPIRAQVHPRNPWSTKLYPDGFVGRRKFRLGGDAIDVERPVGNLGVRVFVRLQILAIVICNFWREQRWILGRRRNLFGIARRAGFGSPQ
jgi:hypothetical protein